MFVHNTESDSLLHCYRFVRVVVDVQRIMLQIQAEKYENHAFILIEGESEQFQTIHFIFTGRKAPWLRRL